MRQYKLKETKEITKEVEKIICNKCGKVILTENGISEEVLSVEKRWGYFSNKDNEVHQFDLCEECYDKMISEFIFPVKADGNF